GSCAWGSGVCHPSFFLFSGRRRHTRTERDWSSDVCSSDLATSWSLPDSGNKRGGGDAHLKLTGSDHEFADSAATGFDLLWSVIRSEERRVGKEERCLGGGERRAKEAEVKVRTRGTTVWTTM